jgi:hypothetical protein
MRRPVDVPEIGQIETGEWSRHDLVALIDTLRQQGGPERERAAAEIQQAVDAEDHRPVEDERPRSRQRRDEPQALVPTGPQPVVTTGPHASGGGAFAPSPAASRGAFVQFPTELVVSILQWAGEVNELFGTRVALDTRTLARVATLNRWWNNLVLQCVDLLGYDRLGMLEAEKRARIKATHSLGLSAMTAMTPGEMRGLTELTRRLLLLFPPGEHAYIALGNSSAALLANLQLRRRDAAVMFLPATALTPMVLNDLRDRAAHQRAKRFLDTHIHPTMLQGREKVVVVDVVASGLALVTAEQLVGAYYGAYKHDVEVILLAMNPNDPEVGGWTEYGEEPEDDEEVAFPLQRILGLGETEGSAREFQAHVIDASFKLDLLYLMWLRVSFAEILSGRSAAIPMDRGAFQRMVVELVRLPRLLQQLDS